MKNYIIFILLLLNIFLFYFYKRKKLKMFFLKKILKSKIKSINLSNLHPMFLPIKNTKKFKFPSEEIVIKSFVVDKSFNIIGQTSDYEAWILSCFSKFSKNIFEFGTASGKTTTLFALNSPDNSKIHTITLKPKQVDSVSFKKMDSKVAIYNALNESIYDDFIFKSMNICNKINLIFGDSKKFNEKELSDQIDLIFIDGGHNYSCVKNDTEKAFSMLRKGGYIFWHDYVIGKTSSKDVVKYLNEISIDKKIFHIKDTSLCCYQRTE